MRYRFDAELWIWDARRVDTWTFVRLPPGESAEIREVAAALPKGFGSVRVEVAVGGSTWRTSVFPDAASGCYVLPIKKSVRRSEGIEAGDVVAVELELVDF